MNVNNKNIKKLINLLNKEYFIEKKEEDCEIEVLAKNRRIALKIAIEFCYSINTIVDLIYLNKYGEYEDEHDLYQIKNLLVRSLIYMDNGGNSLVMIAFDENLEWHVRTNAIYCMEFIANKKNIIKLKDLLVNYVLKKEEIWMAVLSVFSNRPIYELLSFLKTIEKIEDVWTMVNEQLQITIMKIKDNY